MAAVSFLFVFFTGMLADCLSKSSHLHKVSDWTSSEVLELAVPCIRSTGGRREGRMSSPAGYEEANRGLFSAAAC